MHARAIAVVFSSLIGTSASAQNPPGLPGGTPPPAKQPDRTPAAGVAAQPAAALQALDGTWTVVAATRNATAVVGAERMTVTIKDGVVTFEGTDPKAGMRALRLEAGANGTVRVAEAGADGKFAASTPPDRAGVGGPGTNTPPDRIGGGGIRPDDAKNVGTMSGVYVLAGDYAALSVLPAGAPAGATSPATPTAASYVSVVLKRSGR